MMTPHTDELGLQVGGAINPRTSVYIIRLSDDELLQLLERGEYCNVLCSRQMGKTSLIKRTKMRLAEKRYDTVEIDIAGYLGSPQDANEWYQGLLQGVARQLDLQVDVRAWWQRCGAVTLNQRLIQFFHDEVASTAKNPVVIFLDEIDSTLKFPYTDDFFVALRSMYNDRASEPVYERLTFCLVGVATPNELIKDHRTTPYNIGKTIELQDFDPKHDDLSLLFRAVSDDTSTGQVVVEKVLSWTGGHPFLTQWLCQQCIEHRCTTDADVTQLATAVFANLDAVRTHPHFQAITRFFDERTDKIAAPSLYRNILLDWREPDLNTLPHAQLKLTGLVKRDGEGYLVVRNAIYQRIYTAAWVAQFASPVKRLTRITQTNFYDPIYNVITSKRMFWDSESEVIFDYFEKLMNTYEYCKLNLNKQEGLALLEFPSADHSKFSATLGCWHLAVWAIDNVLVSESTEGSTRFSVGLNAKLKYFGLQKEFLLASLLSNLGHLPYNFAIENDHFLRVEYKRRQGIQLRQDVIGISLLTGKDHKRKNGTNKESVFELYKKFTNEQMDGELDNEIITHDLVSKWEKEKDIKLEWIVYLLDPMEPEPVSNAGDEDKKLMGLLRHLISGVVNLGNLDRYNRIAHFTAGASGVLPIRELLHHLGFEYQSGKHFLFLFDDGIDHAFELLYRLNISLRENFFHNINKLSYEVMLNYAICRHWKRIKQEKKKNDSTNDRFLDYLPFMNDYELFHTLMYSEDQKVRKTIRRIHLKDPFICIGRYRLTQNAYDDLKEKAFADLLKCNDEEPFNNLQDQCRQEILSHFEEFEDKCFIRFEELFGELNKYDKMMEHAKNWNPCPLLMDLEEIFVKQAEGYITLSEVEEYKKAIELIREQDSKRRREFWLFLEDDDSKLKAQIQLLAASKDWEIIPTY